MRFSSLQSRDFRLLLAGQAISLTGNQMQQVALVWQLYLLTRSPLSLGLLGLFRVIPIIVFALGGGVAADALDRRWLMFASQAGMMLVSAALAAATYFGVTTPALIYGLAALGGAAFAFDSPARQALVPALVGPKLLPNALSLYATVFQVAAVAGPALGGAVIAWSGVLPVYLIDIASFLAVLGALIALRHDAPSRGISGLRISAVAEGFAFMLRSRLILATMLLDFVATFLAWSLLLLPIYAEEIFGVGARGLGLLYAAQPFGAASMAALLSWLPPIRRQGKALLLAVSAYGASIAVFGASRWFPLGLVALAASGAADAVSMVMRQTLRQLLTPDELRGRMTSINMMFFAGGPQLGEVEAGAVAKVVGVRAAVWSGGLLCVAAAAVCAVLVPSLRTYEHAPVEPAPELPPVPASP